MLKITNKGEAVVRPDLATVCNLFSLVPRKKEQKEHGTVVIQWIFCLNSLGLMYPLNLECGARMWGLKRACSDSVVMLEINQAIVAYCLSFKVTFEGGNV